MLSLYLKDIQDSYNNKNKSRVVSMQYYHKEIIKFCQRILFFVLCMADDYTHRISCKTQYKNSAKNLTEVKNEHIYTKPGSHTIHYESSMMSKEMDRQNTGYIVLRKRRRGTISHSKGQMYKICF